MAKTYNNLYLDIRQHLLGVGIAMASLEAREIMRHVTGKDRMAIIRDYHLYVPPVQEKQAMELVSRRLDGEPIAYIIGEWEFFGLTLAVNTNVLIPRVDTEVLAGKAIALAKQIDHFVIDFNGLFQLLHQFRIACFHILNKAVGQRIGILIVYLNDGGTLVADRFKVGEEDGEGV